MATNHLTELDKGIDLKLRVGCSQLKVGNVEYPSEDGNDGEERTWLLPGGDEQGGRAAYRCHPH